jgi:hypothetical protein
MTGVVPLLAVAQEVEDLLEQAHSPKSSLAQILIIFGSLFAVTGIIAVWLIYFRKKRHHHEHHWKTRDARPGDAADSSKIAVETGNRKERRRRKQRPRNPTLAETRGLPPVREQPSNRPPSY